MSAEEVRLLPGCGLFVNTGLTNRNIYTHTPTLYLICISSQIQDVSYLKEQNVLKVACFQVLPHFHVSENNASFLSMMMALVLYQTKKVINTVLGN